MRGAGAIWGALRGGVAGLADLLLPGVCPGCNAAEPDSEGLCEACGRELLSLVALPYCPRCGTTVGPNIPVREDGCAGCETVLPRFVRVVRLGPYASPLLSVITGMKYRRRDAMRRLGRMLAEAVKAATADEGFDLVVPVPMHWRRRFARGCNHAGILAGAVARGLRLPLGDDLIRVRNTPPQVHLPKSRRVGNVRGAFGVRPRARIEGARVLLVDDVTTTGATANEASRTLLSAGALRVTLAVVAKTEPPTAYAQHLAE